MTSEPDIEEVTLPVAEVERLRRGAAELEVKAQRLDDEAFALSRQLRETHEQLALSNRRVADLEASTEEIIIAAKAQCDEAEEARHEAEKARASLKERNLLVEDLLEQFTAAGERVTELESALSLKERLGPS